MKKEVLLFVIPFGLTLMFSACGPSQAEYDLAVQQADSLRRLADNQRWDLMEINSFVNCINESLDSISMQEQILVYSHTDEDGNRLSRRKVVENLSRFEMLLQRQHAHIQQLQDSLQQIAGDPSARSKVIQLTKMITFLNKQLSDKETEINTLKAEIASNKRDIADLQKNITDLNENVAQLETANQILSETAATQDEMLNKGYYLIDTHRNLVSKGLVSKRNILKGSKLKLENLDKSAFTNIDIRNTTTFRINGKNPKVLSANPENSYRIVSNSDGTSTLTILDINSFWNSMPYLIIETD